VLILGHRGASAQAPENTVAAFALAAAMGADGIELDVHRSADDELVVVHDAGVAGFGLIVDHPFAALRAAHPEIPTLAEALDACTGMALVNIEIKCCAWDEDPDPDRIVAKGVADLVVARDLVDSTVVSSFDLAIINDLRSIAPQLTTGWLVQGVDPSQLVAAAAQHGHAWLHPDWGNLKLRLHESVAAAHEAGIRLDTWTVDDPETIRAFAHAGVDALITNTPDVARSVLSDRYEVDE
jgi:glycerophosphoryl diester phosphodiesterase